MNKLRFTVLSIALLSLGLTGCKKEYDNPPANTIPDGNILTLTDLRNMYTGTAIEFTQDYNVYCVVTADETSGNLYKEVYVTDGPAAINVRLAASGGLYEGDSIRINLNGTVLDEYNGMLQLDQVDVDVNVVKQATNVTVTPIPVTINDIIANPNLQAQLVRIDGVEFLNTDVGTTFADAVNQFAQNKTLLDCFGSQVLVRTSGYSQFAGDLVPGGNGSVIAVIGQYNADKQLYLRRTSDVNLTNPSCQPTVYLQKDFEDLNVTSGGWTVQMVSGGINWTANTMGAVFGSAYGQISNYSGSNIACETWLISPAINLTGATAPSFSFQNAYNYSGAPIQVFVSTDYDGVSDPNSSGTWTALSPALSTGAWSWVYSGALDLTSYISGTTYVAFKYTGTNSDGSTWEIDEILIED